MKYLPALFLSLFRRRARQRNLWMLFQFLGVLTFIVAAYSVLFHFLMAWEGRSYSWLTGLYWTLTVMSTLGFGDITFESDLGRLFSVVVLLTGIVLLLILLPFAFIQFLFAPWMEAQAASYTPRQAPEGMRGHVVLTQFDPVTAALITRLAQYHYPYLVLVPDVNEALRLYDLGLEVVVGDLDDPETYRRVRVGDAALVATTANDMVNTNVAFTVREVSPTVPVVATANFQASVDILELAGCNRVLQLGELLGQALARRVLGSDAKAHVIGQFGPLLVAEASAANTPLVGKRLTETGLREHLHVNVAGVWERGRFEPAGPDTRINPHTVLVLVGSREQMDRYDELFCIYNRSRAAVVIIGGGRVGRAAGRALAAEGVDYRIVEQRPDRVRDPARYVVGNAADLQVLKQAGILETPAVLVTTHDDDVNVYLTIYCRRLRPDMQIISRATLERNISTLHRAGADFVLSYASMGASTVFNVLRRSDLLLMVEGLDVFKVNVPRELAGRTITESALRQRTGCLLIAVEEGEALHINPGPDRVLPAGGKMILIGSAEAEQRFLQRYGKSLEWSKVLPAGGGGRG